MKLLNTLKTALAIITVFLMVATSCTTKNKKLKTQTLSQEIAVEVQPDEKDKTIEEQKTSEQTETTKNESKDERQIDPEKIYEQSEVASAVSTQSNQEVVEFCLKNFIYPDSIRVDGKIMTDLIIEKDGRVSDVIIVKGLHPTLDQESKRVLKLIPKFIPGKLDGQPVRSKYRMPVRVMIF